MLDLLMDGNGPRHSAKTLSFAISTLSSPRVLSASERHVYCSDISCRTSWAWQSSSPRIVWPP